MFQNLAPLQLNQTGAYTPIPLEGKGGLISITIPAFMSSESGIYEIGIYNGDNSDPGYIDSRRVAITPYRRFEMFEVPPSLSAPHLGLRLIQHPALSTADITIAPQFHLPPALAALDDDAILPEWTFVNALPTGG